MATATLSQPAADSHHFSLPTDKYRGAVVEDLQLSPAFTVHSSDTIFRAIESAYERDFSHIPVLDRHRKPLGYIDVATLKTQWEAGKADAGDKVNKYMTRFTRTSEQPYTVITPLTPLNELETFLKHNIFAIVTDPSRKFVVALATPQDLQSFVTRHGFGL
ncbi:CBS domain-containing protein [Mycena indigotica]|uniref:CBS domain-containing protein n=1 Tax=Mycena indigotica TaxID=2126181 RepID=A0A8H6RZJ8_9AGAR|nr:CBS domain-containing protein [Mycena indigotica]KAF7289896.1 CBS domain-containing protein [Mycena indigotica]